jgi:hypothetical protein
MSEKIEFYRLEPILSKNCQYNVIFGKRSNGKTYATLEYGLRKYVEHGEKMAYIRRWKEDYRGKRGTQLFENLENNGLISEITDGEYDRVKYYAGKWYLAKWDPDLNKSVASEDEFCYAFALSDMEHDKSTAYPDVTTIIFDEFLTRQYYLPNEFVLFMNVLSTIIRHRDNVKIFMLGNTVNKFCPYFKEMGLSHAAEMEVGKIDIYSYGESNLHVAVERCKSPKKNTVSSDVYFAFDNPSLQMITGGAWEIDLYPHLPRKYKPSEVVFKYYINFNDTLLQCEIIFQSDCTFTYVHRKTTPIKNPDKDIIFSEAYDPRPNYFRNIRRPTTDLEKRIATYFRKDKVFYQDNEVGEVVRNYLMHCATNR